MTGAPGLLAINNYHYRRGGAEAIFLDHMALFAGIGWDVVPFAMQHPNNLPSPYADYFVSEIEFGHSYGPLTKIAHAGKVIYSREAQTRLAALIDKTQPSVAHAHNVYHHISPSVFPTLQDAGIPVVMTVHDLKLACPAYKMLRNGTVCEQCKGGAVHNVLLNRCIKGSLALSGVVYAETLVHRALGLYRDKVDRFVVPSQFYRDKLIEWGWAAEKLVHVPNFVDTASLAPHHEEGDYFVFAGRLAPEKGLTTLIEAVRLAGARLVIAGNGPDETALKGQAEASGADIVFAGHIGGPALHDLIGRAKALILPSEWYENAPVSLLEAYGLGTPVIGADIGGIPELIRAGVTGLIAQSGDATDLATKISAMAALPPAQRRSMGAAGRAWVETAFSATAYRERTLAVYRDLGVAA